MRSDEDRFLNNIIWAIVERALLDYQYGRKMLKKGTKPHKTHEYEKMVTENLSFFKSEWFRTLTGFDSDWFIEEIVGQYDKRGYIFKEGMFSKKTTHIDE